MIKVYDDLPAADVLDRVWMLIEGRRFKAYDGEPKKGFNNTTVLLATGWTAAGALAKAKRVLAARQPVLTYDEKGGGNDA